MSNQVIRQLSAYVMDTLAIAGSRFRRMIGVLPLLAVATALQAQTGTLTGRVTDGSNGEPLAGVQIRLGTTLQGATTREDGTYRLQATPGTYAVRVARIGFATRVDSVTITAGQTATQDFTLVSMILNLDPSVV